jgi:N-acetylmuramoyl-L-alanine amidase
MKQHKNLHRQILLIVSLLVILPVLLSAAELNYKTTHEIDHIQEGEIIYLSLSDLAAALGFEIDYNPIIFETVLTSRDDRMNLNLFSNYILLNDNLRNIVYPIIYRRADFYLPAVTMVGLLGEFTRIRLVWDNSELTIRGADLEYNVLDLRFSPKTNGYLCEIMLAHPLEYEVLESEGSWIHITLQGGTLDKNYIANRPHSRVIRRIRAFQFDGSAQISLNFRREISELTDNLAFNPPRIQISIIDTLFDYSSVDTIFSDDNFDPIDVIIIDPGHGGIEDGAIGPRGTREKDIVLDIAQKLRQMFEEDENLDVILTRADDTTLLLDERADIANSRNGELFVSIHVNWFEKSSVKGTQTFFLAAAMNDAARATALLENRSALVGKTEEETDSLDDLSLILVDLLQSEYLTESQALAADIQAELIKSLKTKDRGIDQAGFFVLNKVFMPSVLVEVAFISNKHEETLLNKDSFRKKAAEGIYRGIKKFIAKYTPER